ncbi:hypothetical protein [Hymenobacter pini]|uniref:hypothetical protein n=1 Tax=Hymenobacter pini TaxID=2880879 RepID=UPI001CF15AC6|nr:hypothetical protein [Hymenobacter pini]
MSFLTTSSRSSALAQFPAAIRTHSVSAEPGLPLPPPAWQRSAGQHAAARCRTARTKPYLSGKRW